MSPAQFTPRSVLTDKMFARAWHAVSDHVHDGIAFDEPGCTCRNYASQVRAVVALLTGAPIPEPAGLGAVVINPLTNKVYVRDAHPALPWHKPEDESPEHWSDPTCEDWFLWKDLPRPLVVQSPGWTPPPSKQAASPQPPVSEPTGLGAVVVDREGRTWVRVEAGGDPWLNPASLADGVGDEALWEDLAHPVTIRNHGWDRR